MEKYSRIKALISLDAIRYNFEQMKKNIKEGTKIDQIQECVANGLLEHFICKDTFVVTEDWICKTHICAGTCLQGNDKCPDHWIKAHDGDHDRSWCQEYPSGSFLLRSQCHTFFLGIHRNSSFQAYIYCNFSI